MPKTTKAQKPKTSIHYIKVIDDSFVTVEEEGTNEEYGPRDCTHTSHYIEGIKEVSEQEGWDLVVPFKPEPRKQYFLVYCLYTTGDSFGWDSGIIEFIGLYEDRDLADATKKRIENHYKDAKKRDSPVEVYNSKGELYSISAPWIGYFESLDDVVVESVQTN
jgi:hypothetical protein